MTVVPLSGEQYVLEGYGYRAEIAAVGATLRSLSVEGRDLVAGFPAERMRPAMRGAVLVPWPNRTADGSYVFGAETHHLTVDEPATRTAAHGLVAWSQFVPAAGTDDGLTLHTTLAARPGYPWRPRVSVGFTLTPDGLHQEVRVGNESDRAAPVGIGGHPYLVAGPSAEGSIDGWVLELDAGEVLVPSAERLLPERSVRVGTAPELDFRVPRPLGGTLLNHCYTGLARAADGSARARLRGPDGSGAQIVWDRRCPWVQLYTADEPVDGARRAGVAIEPMTCPPDALNSQVDLLTVQPGQTASAGWCIGAV